MIIRYIRIIVIALMTALFLTSAVLAVRSDSGAKQDKTGAKTAQIKLPAERAYLFWMSYTDPDGNRRETSPAKIEGTTDEIDYSVLGFAPKNIILSVLDPRSGNMAIKSLERKDGALPDLIKLKFEDFDHVRSVRIRVTARNGRPIESALVSLTDAANKTMTRIVDPTSGGEAIFQDVAAGTVTVRVDCAGKRSLNDVDIPLKRQSAVFATEIPIPGNVPTLKPAAAPEGGEARRAVPAPRSPGFTVTTLIQTIVGLVFLILIGSIVFMVLKSKKTTIAEVLKKAGVTLPGETETSPAGGAPAAQPQVDPSVCQFCGQKKDPVTGACACAIPTATTTAAAAGPRLIGIAGPYMGQVFQIVGDVSTIGREAANNIALTQDATTSRRHARIARQDGGFLIQDEGSANGTMVNGRRITEPTSISPGDEIQIGSTRFRFEVS